MEKENKLPASSLNFLKDLQKNNNSEWFNTHKEQYLAVREHLITYADEVIFQLNKTDHIETVSGKKAMYRIYRDVRFSKNKTPYNSHWSGLYKRATKGLRGSYYFRVEPSGNSMIGGGFWGPNSADIKLIRSHLAEEPERLRKIIQNKKFKEHFGVLQGEQVKTAPRGYAKDHPAIDLLKYKSFYIFKKFSDKEIQRDDFVEQSVKTYKAMKPFLDYMSEILTTDLNGVSLID